MKKHISKLGYKAQDKVTGIKGVISSIDFDLYGCIQVLLTYSKDNEEANSGWIDISRIDIISKHPVMENPFYKNDVIDNGQKGPASKPTK